MKRTRLKVLLLAATAGVFPLCLCSAEEARPANAPLPQGFECEKIDKPYVHLPMKCDAPELKLLVKIDGELQHAIDVKPAQDKPDWNGTFSVQKWMGKKLTIVPEKPLAGSGWLRNMKISDQLSWPSAWGGINTPEDIKSADYPLMRFRRGWGCWSGPRRPAASLARL